MRMDAPNYICCKKSRCARFELPPQGHAAQTMYSDRRGCWGGGAKLIGQRARLYNRAIDGIYMHGRPTRAKYNSPYITRISFVYNQSNARFLDEK